MMRECKFIKACNDGDTEKVKRMLNISDKSDLNQQNNEGETGLMKACYWNRIDVVKTLINDERIDLKMKDNKGQTAFMKACCRRSKDVVEAMLDKVDINERDKNNICVLHHAFFEAAPCFDYLVIIKLLLKQDNIDLNFKFYNLPVLIFCLRLDDKELISLLLDRGAKLTVDRYENLEVNVETLLFLRNEENFDDFINVNKHYFTKFKELENII